MDVKIFNRWKEARDATGYSSRQEFIDDGGLSSKMDRYLMKQVKKERAKDKERALKLAIDRGRKKV